MAVIKALVRRDGLRLAQGEPERTAAKLATLELPAELAPLVALLAPLNAQIEAADRDLATLAAGNPVVARLRTAPGIGPVTAVAFVATLDAVERFASAHQVAAYLGLVPSEQSSGERQHRGRITKQGNTRMRWLLVEAAWRILRSPGGWPGCSTPCGATAAPTACRASDRPRRWPPPSPATRSGLGGLD